MLKTTLSFWGYSSYLKGVLYWAGIRVDKEEPDHLFFKFYFIQPISFLKMKKHRKSVSVSAPSEEEQ